MIMSNHVWIRGINILMFMTVYDAPPTKQLTSNICVGVHYSLTL